MTSEQDDDQQDEEPQTKKEFSIFRGSYSNTTALCHTFLQDRRCQKRMRILIDGCEDLHTEYVTMLAAHKGGSESLVYHAAAHSAGEWWQTACKILDGVHSSELPARLDLSPSASCGPAPAESPELQAEIDLVMMNFKFRVDLASNRCWSQMFYTMVFPYNIAQAFNKDMAARVHASQMWKNCFTAVMKAEELMESSKEIALLVDHLATNTWQLTRELMCIGERCNWDAANEELRDFAYSLAAGPVSTKFTLEDTFNWLQDVAQRQSKSKQINVWCKYMYSVLAPYSESGGLPPLEVAAETYWKYGNGLLKDDFHLTKNSPVFNLNRTELPDEFNKVKPSSIRKWRPAGFHANRNAAAAMAYALHDHGSSFSHIKLVWTGNSILISLFA
jgi:hypothetical protein